MAIRSDEIDFGLNDVRVPKEPRPLSEHRLLVHDANSGSTEHSMMFDLGNHLLPGDLLVFNDSRVLPIALYLDDVRFILVVEPQFDSLSNVRVICPFKPAVGETLKFPFADVVLLDHEPGWDVYRANIIPSGEIESLSELIGQFGKFPLPIYIQRQPRREDERALQNFYAEVDGSIAPPVAGTHFSPELVASLNELGVLHTMVTLHVGYGTFRSFKSEFVDDHRMDSERFHASEESISMIAAAMDRGSRVVAVGTTAVRVLETLGQDWEGALGSKGINGETSIFIKPPYTPKIVGGLITNFQYPRLPVIAMAATFVGLENLREVYVDAFARDYAFYSYGDAMLLKF